MEKIYGTKKYEADATTFSGVIDIPDFSTVSPNKKRIQNQADANNLKLKLIKENNKKAKEKKYKQMTLEELREMKIISNTNGKPRAGLTDKEWQKEYAVRKLFLYPYPKKTKKLGGKYSKEPTVWEDEKSGAFLGCTNWQQYCSFINNILDNIRSGQVDYCYYIYQIIDLARFHYDTLKTKYYEDGYWKVWLNKK